MKREEWEGIKPIEEEVEITFRNKLIKIWKEEILLFSKDFIIVTSFVLLASVVLILAGDKKGFYSDGLVILFLALMIGFISVLVKLIRRRRRINQNSNPAIRNHAHFAEDSEGEESSRISTN